MSKETMGPSPPSRSLLWLILSIATLGVAGDASADWLVTRVGELIETEGIWQVEDQRVYFIAGSSNPPLSVSPQRDLERPQAVTAGTLYFIPLAEVDLARSEAETARRLAQGASGTQSKVDPRARKASRILVDPPSTPGSFLEAREDWEESRGSAARVEFRLRLRGTTWDNFFQAPEDRPPEEMRATRTEGRLTLGLARQRRLKAYLEAGEVSYDELPSNTAYGGGLRYDGRRHAVDLGLRSEKNRRALNIGDDFEAADILTTRGAYSLRSRQWEWRLAGELLQQQFEISTNKDSELRGAEASVLYRGLGRAFAPEVGAGRLERDALGGTEDYSERELYLKLRFSPLRIFAGSVLLQQRDRDYSISDSTARNFGRQDRRGRFTVQGEVLVRRNLALNVAYDRQEGDSTRASRNFTAQTVTAGVTLKLASSSQREPGVGG